MLVKPSNMPTLRECGATLKEAKDGHWYCVRKAKCVCSADCWVCDMRPKSMYLREDGE